MIGSVLIIVVLSMWLQSGATREAQLIVYCAAGMIGPMQETADRYRDEYGIIVQIEPGGSGKLLAQIRITRGRDHIYPGG